MTFSYRYVSLNKDGFVQSHGSASVKSEDQIPSDHLVISNHEYTKIIIGRKYKIGDISNLIEVDKDEPDLADLKQRAIMSIDNSAENARLRFITRGSGQAIEYIMTMKEAELYGKQGDLGILNEMHYPFLLAESEASGLTLASVAIEVNRNSNYTLSALVKIKSARRRAKIRVELAVSQAEINSILSSLNWPSPKS